MSRASLIRYLVFARHFRSSSNNYLRDITSRTPSISANNVKEYLAECKLPFSNGHSSYIVSPCPLCSIKDKDTTLFVNKTTGSSVCSTCKFTGIFMFAHIYNSLFAFKSTSKLHCNDFTITNIVYEAEIYYNYIYENGTSKKIVGNSKLKC